MEGRNKIFISRHPSDNHLDYVKDLLEDIDIEEYLDDSFIYVNIFDKGGAEVLSFKNEHVFHASKELSVNNKMAIEYLIRSEEIKQKFNEVCYWNEINNMKKFVVVVSEVKTKNDTVKNYASEAVYSETYVSAVMNCIDKGLEDYLYLENVDA
tara:strand:+ start:720 stop:1178 length:459 start_codon:yes stop_codon:yes gene_type:complete